MLFDLQGKRRRVVQATYLMLAVLMGGGLVLFGIGGSVSGGLLDAFSGGGGGNGNDVIQDRIDRNEDKVETRPQAQAPRKELVRDYYQLAVAQSTATGTFPEDAQDELRHASTHWNAYLELEDGTKGGKPDDSLANVALRIYDPGALNQPQQALRAARIIADANPKNVNTYILLVQYASQAGDKRTEKLAEQKALSLARNKQEVKAVKAQIKQLKGQAIAQQLQKSGKVDVQGLTGGASKKGESGSGEQQNDGTGK